MLHISLPSIRHTQGAYWTLSSRSWAPLLVWPPLMTSASGTSVWSTHWQHSWTQMTESGTPTQWVWGTMSYTVLPTDCQNEGKDDGEMPASQSNRKGWIIRLLNVHQQIISLTWNISCIHSRVSFCTVVHITFWGTLFHFMTIKVNLTKAAEAPLLDYLCKIIYSNHHLNNLHMIMMSW